MLRKRKQGRIGVAPAPGDGGGYLKNTQEAALEYLKCLSCDRGEEKKE